MIGVQLLMVRNTTQQINARGTSPGNRTPLTPAAAAAALVQVGFSTMPIRKRLFTKAFFEKEFPGEFKGPGEQIPELGYPDAGAGQFSQKLSTKDWMEFANSQRAHGQLPETEQAARQRERTAGTAHSLFISGVTLCAHSLFQFSGARVLCLCVSGNYVEGAAPMLTFLLISGLFFPRFSVACGAAYIVGRALYTGGYKMKGSRGRKVGVLILDLGLLGVMGGALIGSFNFAGGIAGLKALF